jgi:phage tail sheath protein FI
MPVYTTPGVYIEEIPRFPPSVSQVRTSIPVFIGATQKAEKVTPNDLLLVPLLISSMIEYEQYYGLAKPETAISVIIDTTSGAASAKASMQSRSGYLMYYSMLHFFANGGSDCYIISVGDYTKPVETTDLLAGLEKATETRGIMMLLFPDAMSLSSAAEYYNICKEAIKQAAFNQDRFALIDVWRNDNGQYAIDELRSYDFGDTRQLSFGAAYYPCLISSHNYFYTDAIINCPNDPNLNGTLEELLQKDQPAYHEAKKAIAGLKVLLPATPAVAGIYCRVDNSRGVWKAPANEIVYNTIQPEIIIGNDKQNELNVHFTGRSINAIRLFTGKGVRVWGARTLAGNDNEWRYIPVRRYFIMIEQSIKHSTLFAVFEPNDATTWIKLKTMITNFLILQWKQGALAGAKTDEGFYVKVGLGETMTQQDILEGNLIIEVGLAMMRPAEFMIIRYSHKLATS